MKRSIALAQETDSPPASGEPGLGNKTENTITQPDSESISESAQASASQREEKPERKKAVGKLIKQSELSKRDSTFMPAMSIEAALARHAAMVEFTRRIMVRNQDFGDIQGAHKPALLKPGAEKLCSFFGLEPEFTPLVEEIDWTGAWHEGEALCYVRYRCRLLRDGRILGVGEPILPGTLSG
jgi:hypothetical protein